MAAMSAVRGKNDLGEYYVRKVSQGGMLLDLLTSTSTVVAQVEVKNMTMMDEPRGTYIFMRKLEYVLDKLTAKGLPVTDALRRAHGAMLMKARELFIMPTFDIHDPGNVQK